MVMWMLIATGISWAGDDVVKEKRISRSYKMSKDVKVSLTNQFGKVHVNTWDKPELTVDITITVEKTTDAKAQELIDKIGVIIDDQGKVKSFKTVIQGSVNNKNGEKFEINYVVNMPKNNPLDLENKFGDVYLADISGPLNLKVSYGQLKAGHLTNTNTTTSLEFGGGHITAQEDGTLTVKYSSLTVEKLGNVSLDNQFSDINVNSSGNMVLNSKYGDVKIGKSQNISGKVSFSGFQLANLDESLTLNASYVNALKIEKVDKGFRLISINGNFSSCEIYLPMEINCDTNLTTRFGDVKYNKDKISFNYINVGNTKSEYKGKIGSSTKAPSNLQVNTSYGNIKIIIVER